MNQSHDHAHTINLPGLREDNPRDFMAAIGLLRLFEFLWPDNPPLISWESKSPIISFANKPVDNWGDEIWSKLKRIAADQTNPLIGRKIEDISALELRGLLTGHELLPNDFYASFAGQGPFLYPIA